MEPNSPPEPRGTSPTEVRQQLEEIRQRVARLSIENRADLNKDGRELLEHAQAALISEHAITITLADATAITADRWLRDLREKSARHRRAVCPRAGHPCGRIREHRLDECMAVIA